MNKNIYIIIVFSLISLSTVAQTNKFFKFVVECDSLYKYKKYSEVIDLFKNGQNDQTFEFKFRMNDYYYIACCYALVGDKNNAFVSLNKLIEKYQYSDTSIFKDKDFNDIKNDERWNKFRSEVLVNQKKIEFKKIKYIKLKAKLDSLYKIDQIETSYLDHKNLIKFNQFGKDSLRNLIYQSAKNRSVEVMNLMIGMPWLDQNILGVDGFDMIFLSVQHSGDIKKMEKLLHKYKSNRKTPVEYAHYAMLYDRIRIKRKSKQRFGTQILISINSGKKFYYRIEDFSRVNEYRKYCYYDTIQEDMLWHNMLIYEETTYEEQENIK